MIIKHNYKPPKAFLTSSDEEEVKYVDFNYFQEEKENFN